MCENSFEQTMLEGSPEWRVGKERGPENIFFYSYVPAEKSDANASYSPPPPAVFHNSTKGRVSFSHSPTRRHSMEGKRFGIPFVRIIELLSYTSAVKRPMRREEKQCISFQYFFNMWQIMLFIVHQIFALKKCYLRMYGFLEDAVFVIPWNTAWYVTMGL
jgi:hypothetical protein